MGPRTGLDILEKRKISCLSRIQIPDHPAHGLIILHYHSYELTLDFIYSSLQDKCGQQGGPTDESGLQATSGEQIWYYLHLQSFGFVASERNKGQKTMNWKVSGQQPINYIFRLPGANSEIEYKGHWNPQPVMNFFGEVAFILNITVFLDVMLLDCGQLPFQEEPATLIYNPIVKPTRWTSFSNYLFLHHTLHILDGFSVHHQQFKTVHTAIGICHTGTAICLLAGTRCPSCSH